VNPAQQSRSFDRQRRIQTPRTSLASNSSICAAASFSARVALCPLLGHSRPSHSAPLPINVRCYSNSGQMQVPSDCPLSAISRLMHRRNCITKRDVYGYGRPQDTAGRNCLMLGVNGVTSTRYFPSVERHLVVGRWMRCIQCLKILRSERQ
jgi:hypothetical protein